MTDEPREGKALPGQNDGETTCPDCPMSRTWRKLVNPQDIIPRLLERQRIWFTAFGWR